ncbi:hypothetical protein ACM46_08020 [Chryseobacterium angstadtii]|uniref:Uncharacterized protein n=1 Tax=Chryseobacterium angstadtii TaxID=558151 RepID=A0A0J7L9W4_9FLAO|nr:hypothetical protein ACM46_08020 [Chryseobacterium angstadtii]
MAQIYEILNIREYDNFYCENRLGNQGEKTLDFRLRLRLRQRFRLRLRLLFDSLYTQTLQLSNSQTFQLSHSQTLKLN